MPRRSLVLPTGLITDPAPSTRLWEIDALRGVSVVLMICFHFAWDLQFFGLAAVDVFSAPWQIFARATGSSFTLLLGLSLALCHERGALTTAYVVRRAGLLLGIGMVITLATALFVGPAYVRFGILHLLGVSTLLVWVFVRVNPWFSALVGGVFIAAGVVLARTAIASPWLIWLGVQQEGITMVDYYPLLPWAGFALLGVSVGRELYRGTERALPLPSLADVPLVGLLRWLGRHSLLMYLLHQPFLIGLLLIYQALL